VFFFQYKKLRNFCVLFNVHSVSFYVCMVLNSLHFSGLVIASLEVLSSFKSSGVYLKENSKCRKSVFQL